ncbi:hypothetical protein UlMin_030877 [Ulmus minor]
MVDSEKRTKKAVKRKQTSYEKHNQSPKKYRKLEDEEETKRLELSRGFPWRNLDLILSIQNKNLDLQEKVEMAFDFVISNVKEEGNEPLQDCGTVTMSRLIIFLNNWVQSLLISSEASLDLRCWKIFKFCLEESLKLDVSLSFLRNLLRSISFVAKSMLSQPSKISSSSEGFELYFTVLDCVSLVFSSHGGLSNENLDLWVSTILAVLELTHKIFAENLGGGDAGACVLQLSCLIFEPFAKFLRAHTTRKNGFQDFIDKLLEPLLHTLGILHHQIDECCPDWRKKLLKLVEDVLSHGLFHPVHIDGFLTLHSTEKYAASHDERTNVPKTVIKSYHRHFFVKVERIVAAKKELATCSMGKVFCLLVDRVKDVTGAVTGNTESQASSTTLTAERRKSLFDFFVLLLEPHLLEINGYLVANHGMGSLMLDAHCTLKSMNNLLGSFMREKVYLRTEDISGGAFVNFLKKVYDMIMSLSSNLIRSSNYDVNNKREMEMLTLLAEEILVAVGYLLEIEYEVIGNDLVSLWLMMFSYLALGLSFTHVSDQHSLVRKITDLGCQLFDLYCKLRQVNNATFTLCRAIRCLHSQVAEEEVNYTRFLVSLHDDGYAKSVGMLLCSQEFKLTINKAIKSIPEGQSSGCIQQLNEDISESLKWIKINDSGFDKNKFGEPDPHSRFDLRAELLGRGLSEVYGLVLNSLTVTMGNSNLVGAVIKDLITLLCPYMTSLVGLQPDAANKFIISFMGKSFGNELAGHRDDLQRFRISTHWVFVFFFQLYMSCRIFYRQAASLMPPEKSRKMSEAMGDLFTAYSGGDWMQRSDVINDGYFSCFVQPSASLPVVIQSVSNIYVQDIAEDCCPLIYVMHAMALQRLVDLNRQINSFEYLLKNNDSLVQNRLLDDADLSRYHKKGKKLEKCISTMKQEAAGLVGFMMEHLTLVSDDQQPIYNSDDTTCTVTSAHASDEWDLGVSSLNKKSLPTAIWWILCQNIDIWCTHADKRNLKKFLSLLICTSLPCERSSFWQAGKLQSHETNQLDRVTMQKISLELFNNSILYEQIVSSFRLPLSKCTQTLICTTVSTFMLKYAFILFLGFFFSVWVHLVEFIWKLLQPRNSFNLLYQFVCRYLASRFCRALEKSALPFTVNSCGNVNLKSLPNWLEALSDLERSLAIFSGNKHFLGNDLSAARLDTHDCGELPKESGKEPKTMALTKMKPTACQSLLNLLSWMPKEFFNSRSFSLLATSILNLERFIVDRLLDSQCSLSHNGCDLLRLFLCCRKVLKFIIMVSFEEKTEASQTSLNSLFSGDSLPVLWLFKSLYAVVGIQELLPEDSGSQVGDMIFSLMDHTLYVFVTLNKFQFNHVIHYIKNAKKSCKEQQDAGSDHEKSESDSFLGSSSYVEGWKSVLHVAKSLREQMQILNVLLKDALYDEKDGAGATVVNFNKFCSIISCFSGFLWGLASVVKETDMRSSDYKVGLLEWYDKPNSEINLCINDFIELSSLLLPMLLLSDAQHIQKARGNKGLLSAEELLHKKSGVKADVSCNKLQDCSKDVTMNCLASSDLNDDPGNGAISRKQRQLDGTNSIASVLTELDSFEQLPLNKSFLSNLLKGKCPEAAFLLRQLLIAASGILRLNMHIKSAPLSANLMQSLTGVSQVLLSELVDMTQAPQPSSFVWLDGVLKYIEELGNHFPLTNPTLSRNQYVKMVELQLRAIGKCITFQGKGATLASHETESSTKMLYGHLEISETSHSWPPHRLDIFKSRLRLSFTVYIKKPSELHLLSAIQAIERSLVGVRERYPMIYDIQTGNVNGGKVSSIVAAGIDCLDLVLEFVSGRKRLSVVKRHIQSLIAGVFNIILHLQSPSIFYERLMGDTDPDPGAVILMCVEVLIRILGKHALFQMDSWHIAQSLRIPAALFQDFHQLKISEGSTQYDSSRISNNDISDPVGSPQFGGVDRQFSINLFAACCRLLYTVLKHHKSECERCIAILEASVSALLHCLETKDSDMKVRNGSFSLEVEEGVKCAYCLRRIYEEIRHQKDVLGRHCSQLLSSYIYVYSGYGPLKTGFKREIDEALRPGVYALIDACSEDDLQYLHTVFGEGPCRNTLATLQHDYKLNFQYEGKV